MKTCGKCKIEKEVGEFYKSSTSKDGYDRICKTCDKEKVKKVYAKKKKDPEWYENEKKRCREKYYKLNYLDKYPHEAEKTAIALEKYSERFPEKISAGWACKKLRKKTPDGYQCHHWSYNKEHWQDIIILETKNHYLIHRYIIYDQERMMYRRVDTMVLLDTKEDHQNWINQIINNFK